MVRPAWARNRRCESSGVLTEETQTEETRAPMVARGRVCPARGRRVEVLGEVPNRAKAKCRKALGTEGELAASSEPISVGAVQGIGTGVGTKFRVLTRGGLWASAHER